MREETRAHWLLPYLTMPPSAPSRLPALAGGEHPGEDIRHGDTLAKYVGACPSEDASLHWYVFLVYAQGERKVVTSRR